MHPLAIKSQRRDGQEKKKKRRRQGGRASRTREKVGSSTRGRRKWAEGKNVRRGNRWDQNQRCHRLRHFKNQRRRRRRRVQIRIEQKGESETKTVAEGKKETLLDQSTDHPQLHLHLQAAAPGDVWEDQRGRENKTGNKRKNRVEQKKSRRETQRKKEEPPTSQHHGPQPQHRPPPLAAPLGCRSASSSSSSSS